MRLYDKHNDLIWLPDKYNAFWDFWYADIPNHTFHLSLFYLKHSSLKKMSLSTENQIKIICAIGYYSAIKMDKNYALWSLCSSKKGTDLINMYYYVQ